MKFIFADSQDYVDPRYDFEADQNGDQRQPYWDDAYSHEMLDTPPYDGVLVSRATVGDPGYPGKYSESQAMRFRRVGARTFLRLDHPRFANMLLFGDCGAFSYAKHSEPPYRPKDTVEFYADGRFTHGCSIDHVIFEFDPKAKNLDGGTTESRQRFDITLELADVFLKESRQLGPSFTPIGVVQGWSPSSMAEATRRLMAMGYRYLAIGGLVPLKVEGVHQAVSAVHEAVGHRSELRLHLLGFAKADHLAEFARYPKIASFDTTSPLIRAFKDARRNYYLQDGHGGMHYYTAIRIPQALENVRLKRQVQTGRLQQEDLVYMERKALDLVRSHARDEANMEQALDAIIGYSRHLHWTPSTSESDLDKKMDTLRWRYRETLSARPWKQCDCAICRAAAVEVAIFRGSNRNKRRGMHNLAVFYRHLQDIYLQ